MAEKRPAWSPLPQAVDRFFVAAPGQAQQQTSLLPLVFLPTLDQ
jgi:hypothetical protein